MRVFYRAALALIVLVALSACLLVAGPRVSGSSASFDTIKAELNSYIWPTDASTRITSTFAEYRSTHFHGGIDISTNGHTGYKVFAVREGYVCRINIEPNGYGKIIYVRHPDGYVSCYAHLKSFSESIEKVSRAEQYRKGTYAIDLTLDSNQVPVQKGETIAYSGDTGFGPAHLHFELRDENLNPVNPLLIPTYHVYDVRPPYIRRFMIAPLAFGSTVDNSAVPKYYSRFPGTRTKRRIPQPIRIHGEIGFAIDAIDFGEYNAIHTGIHRIEFFFDDSLVYAMHLDHMPIDQTKQIDLHYDLPSVMAGRGDFQKLYIDEGNVLPFYDHRPQGSGVIITTHMNDGEHPFRVICYDFNENASELDGSVVIIHRPIMQIADVSDQSIGLKGNLLASISKCTVLGKRLSDTQWSQHTLDSDRFEVSNDEIELPVNSHPYDVLKVIAETRNGVQTMPMYYFKKKPHGSAQSAQLVVEPMLNYAKVSLTCKGMFTGTPVVKIKEGVLERTIELEPVDVNSYVGAFNPLDTYEGEREVIADVEVNGTQDELSKAFQLYEIPANKSGSFIFGNGELTIAYDSGAVYKPLSLQISREYFGNSYMYVLEPQDVLLNGGIKVSLAKPINQTSYRRTGLYSRTNRGWVFQTDSLDSEHNCYTTIFTRTLGDVAVLHDEQPPSIGRLRVIPKKGTVNVAFRYYDNLSGFDPDGVRITIDGRLAIPEIDGEHHLVTCVPDFELAPGKHLLKIAMKDMAKNETSIERVFKSR